MPKRGEIGCKREWKKTKVAVIYIPLDVLQLLITLRIFRQVRGFIAFKIGYKATLRTTCQFAIICDVIKKWNEMLANFIKNILDDNLPCTSAHWII